jgi:hypothetical protein
MNLVRQGGFLLALFLCVVGLIPLGVAWREGLAKRLEGIAGVLASVRYRSGLGRLLLAGIQLERSEGILDGCALGSC